MKTTLKRIDADLKSIMQHLNKEGVKCLSIEAYVQQTRKPTFHIWDGDKHLTSMENTAYLTIADMLKLPRSPERKILFRKF